MMHNLNKLLQDDRLSKTLLDALPCGLLLIDKLGTVLAVNNVFEHIFGVSNPDVVLRGYGDALHCLHSHYTIKGCGQSAHCKQCEIKALARNAFSENRIQKARVCHPLVIDKQVRDANIILLAAPFTFDQMPLCLLMIEDVTSVRFISNSGASKGRWGIVGQSKRMLELFSDIRDVAQTDAPVLIQGESGTGKELVAHAIHKESRRAQKLFVPVNCGALPEGLLESELFGHKKGAYTGATFDKKGRFGLADSGTLFLDEISELDLSLQVKFLRVLESGSFEPLGSDQTIRVDVRVVSATNQDLIKMVNKKRFREDLFYRICVMPIYLPPLRDRREDIPLLVDYFLAQLSDNNRRSEAAISQQVLSILMNHHWPGNIRELKNVIQYALAKCKDEIIMPAHLPAFLSQSRQLFSGKLHREPKTQVFEVQRALKQTKGNRSKAAKLLGVSRSTIYRTLERETYK